MKLLQRITLPVEFSSDAYGIFAEKAYPAGKCVDKEKLKLHVEFQEFPVNTHAFPGKENIHVLPHC